MATSEQRDLLRLRIGDTDVDNPLFLDDELDTLIDGRDGVVMNAVVDACETLAMRYAGGFDVAEDGQSFKLSQRFQQYKAMSDALRASGYGYETGSARVPNSATFAILATAGRRRDGLPWLLCWCGDPDCDIHGS